MKWRVPKTLVGSCSGIGRRGKADMLVGRIENAIVALAIIDTQPKYPLRKEKYNRA